VRLLLARHGQSLWNEVRRFQGSADVGLSLRGRRQAEALGRALRGRPLAAAYVSPMARALDTAAIALEGTGVPIVPVEGLRELGLGQWEGFTVEEISGRDGDPYRRWVRAPLDCPPPGGEALPDACDRVRRALEGIAAHPTARGPRNGPQAPQRPDRPREAEAALDAGRGDVLVVAHGGVIAVYLCHLLGCSFNAVWRLRVDNCSLTTVEPPRIVTLNETSHLSVAAGNWPGDPVVREAKPPSGVL